MYRYPLAVLIAAGVVWALVAPRLSVAQGHEDFTDLRGRSYSEEDLERALIPEKTLIPQVESAGRTRGIKPQGPSVPPPPKAVGLNVFFALNSDKVLPQYYADLDKLGKVIAKHPEYRFQIDGHTDDLGSELYNQALSERRAASIKRYLTRNYGIESERLLTRGYGENSPRFPNTTDEGRAQNRRVEIKTLGE